MKEQTFEDLLQWSRDWFCSEPYVGKTVAEDGTVHIYVNYATFGTAKGSGKDEDEAKKNCAKDGWKQIENGDFVSNDDEFSMYEAWRQGKPHPCKGWMQYINELANEPEDEEEEEIYY